LDKTGRGREHDKTNYEICDKQDGRTVRPQAQQQQQIQQQQWEQQQQQQQSPQTQASPVAAPSASCPGEESHNIRLKSPVL
jgi:transcription initiation factor TFIID subunit TAF12